MNNNKLTRAKGVKLTKVEREALIVKLVDLLNTGYKTDSELAKQLEISRVTLHTLMPLANELIAVTTDDRNIIRNQSINRVNKNIERVTKKLESGTLTFKQEMSAIDRFVKLQSHLALITGLNVETRVNVDHKQLVITRAHPDAVRKALTGEVVNKTDSLDD